MTLPHGTESHWTSLRHSVSVQQIRNNLIIILCDGQTKYIVSMVLNRNW